MGLRSSGVGRDFGASTAYPHTSTPANTPLLANTKIPQRFFSPSPKTKSERTLTPMGVGSPSISRLKLAQPQGHVQSLTRARSNCGRKFLASGLPCSNSHFVNWYSAAVRRRLMRVTHAPTASAQSATGRILHPRCRGARSWSFRRRRRRGFSRKSRGRRLRGFGRGGFRRS